MEQEKSLVKVKENRNGIRKMLNNMVELIKSKISRDYILSENSPESLKRNKDLILKTIMRDPTYLDQVPEDILLEELQQQSFPVEGIIGTAFKRGYQLGKPSSDILLGENAKTAILQYIKMQKDDNSLFGRNQVKISDLLNNLDRSLWLDIEFRDQLIDLAIEKGYRLEHCSADYLKQNEKLVYNYYKDLLENNTVDALSNYNILNPEVLRNKEFLQNYIKLLSQKGIADDITIATLTHNQECGDIFKKDLELFQVVFEQMSPANLDDFLSKFFSNEELKVVLDNKEISGKLLRISQLYDKDDTVLQSLDGRLLNERYQNIPDYKMQLIAKNRKFQDKILELSDYEYILYSKMVQLVSQKTDRWNRFEQNIVDNLHDGYYEELVCDLYAQAKKGDKITAEDIETLTFLFSKKSRPESQQSNNIFNITNKKELEHFEEIKELVCDVVLTNPNLDDERLTTSMSKYLNKFNQLSEIDRVKLALLEKYYNMDLSEAASIVKNFSADIDSISVDDEYQASVVEQVRAIKNIFESNDIDTLSQVGGLDILVKTDLSPSTYLVEQTKEMFEKEYKQALYMPKEDEKIGNTTFNGKEIEVFDANVDFSMIIKKIGSNDNNSQEIWNSLTKDDGELRYYTCTSYMTAENLLNTYDDNGVILGFAQGVKDYSIDAIYPQDAHTPFYGGDDIYEDLDSCYMSPNTLETNTDNNYNEVVINTLALDEQGKIKKMQPDYVVYIKNKSDVKTFDDDPLWEKSKKLASEFGIPIVVIDKEKVRESEKAKIASMSDKIKGTLSSNEVLRYVKKVEHYESRYGREDILEYANEDRINYLKKYIEEKRLKEKENISIPSIDNMLTKEKLAINRQNILRRQTKLKEEKVISGEER